MKTTILGVRELCEIAQRVGLSTLMDETIRRLDRALVDYDASKTRIPAREGFHYSDPAVGLIEWMPVLQTGESATIKIVGYHPRNPAEWNVPTILSTIGTFDTRTGHLAGLADGTFVTALRTGAASAVATKLLASPGSRTLGLIGAGAQSVTQFHALSRVFAIEEVLVYDIDPAVSASFGARVHGLCEKPPVIEVADIGRVVAESDILCTQTSVDVGGGPVFKHGETKPWLHVNAVGSDLPNKTEIPLSLLLRSFVVPDFPEQAFAEGECQQLAGRLRSRITACLADVVQRPADFLAVQQRRTVFDSTGFALEDHVTAQLMFDYATELGIGADVELGSMSPDPRDPYGFVNRPQPSLLASR